MKAMMRNMVMGCLFSCFGMLLVPDAIGQEQASVSTCQKIYMDYLTSEGYKNELCKNGYIQFYRGESPYLIMVDPTDTEVFRLIVPVPGIIEKEEDRAKVMAAANEANSKAKIAKVYIFNNDAFVSAELLLIRQEDIKRVLIRAMAAVDYSALTFIKKLME